MVDADTNSIACTLKGSPSDGSSSCVTGGTAAGQKVIAAPLAFLAPKVKAGGARLAVTRGALSAPPHPAGSARGR